MRYRVLRLVGDPRLPAAYDIAGPATDGFRVLRLAAETWPSLSTEGQAELAPFLAAPAYLPEAGGTGFGQAANAALDCFALTDQARPSVQSGWVGIETAHAIVWYPQAGDVWSGALLSSPEQVLETAEWASEVIEEIYAAETSLFGVEPVPDTDLPCNGGDGRLDIYITRASSRTGALTTAYAPGCELRPTFMTMAPDFAGSAQLVRDVLAHEFAHVLQLGGYDFQADCDDYNWLSEATANWAIDYVYPGDQLGPPGRRQERLRELAVPALPRAPVGAAAVAVPTTSPAGTA